MWQEENPTRKLRHFKELSKVKTLRVVDGPRSKYEILGQILLHQLTRFKILLHYTYVF